MSDEQREILPRVDATWELELDHRVKEYRQALALVRKHGPENLLYETACLIEEQADALRSDLGTAREAWFLDKAIQEIESARMRVIGVGVLLRQREREKARWARIDDGAQEG